MAGRERTYCYCGIAIAVLSIIHIVLISTINKTADVKAPLIKDLARDWNTRPYS